MRQTRQGRFLATKLIRFLASHTPISEYNSLIQIRPFEHWLTIPDLGWYYPRRRRVLGDCVFNDRKSLSSIFFCQNVSVVAGGYRVCDPMDSHPTSAECSKLAFDFLSVRPRQYCGRCADYKSRALHFKHRRSRAKATQERMLRRGMSVRPSMELSAETLAAGYRIGRS